MEFPDLGENCSLKECRRLDFLPIKCSSCKQIFCSEHFRFEQHNCDCKDDHQVPICPLCNKPVPIKAGESADFKVSQHIDQNCNSQREKVFKNRCSVQNCKKKELMPLNCEQCGLNHCLKHRHPTDHDCKGPQPTAKSSSSSGSRFSNFKSRMPSFESFTRKSMNAFGSIQNNVSNTFQNSSFQTTATRQQDRVSAVNSTQQPNITNLQGNLTEEEALNIAIQESLSMQQNSRTTNTNQSVRANNEKCKLS